MSLPNPSQKRGSGDVAPRLNNKKMKLNTNDPDEPKKKVLNFVIQTVINILAAVLTALGAASCVSHVIL